MYAAVSRISEAAVFVVRRLMDVRSRRALQFPGFPSLQNPVVFIFQFFLILFVFLFFFCLLYFFSLFSFSSSFPLLLPLPFPAPPPLPLPPPLPPSSSSSSSSCILPRMIRTTLLPSRSALLPRTTSTSTPSSHTTSWRLSRPPRRGPDEKGHSQYREVLPTPKSIIPSKTIYDKTISPLIPTCARLFFERLSFEWASPIQKTVHLAREKDYLFDLRQSPIRTIVFFSCQIDCILNRRRPFKR